MMSSMPEGRYSAADIEVLEGTEVVRRRPQLYVGDPSGPEAICNLVLEALCLAVDPKTGGPAKQVEVRLLPDDVAEVWNDGPGLPVGRHPKEDVSLIEIIMTRLYACRDAKEDFHNQKWCTVGVAALNALTEWCVVTVRRDGAVWTQRFEKGKAVSDLERHGDCSDSGTTLRFKIDRSLLTGLLDAGTLNAGLKRFAVEVPCTSASLLDMRNA